MDAFISPLHELGSFEELERASAKEGVVLSATGCMDAQKPHMMYGWNNGSGMRVIVTFNEQKARELLDAYRYFDRKAVYFPAKDILSYGLTTLTGAPARNALIFSAVASMIRWRLSFGAQEMCGVMMQFFAFSSGLSARIGSV
mgnify:CR=1 FL=1